MKITKERLKQIIVEELQAVMGEMDMLPMGSEDGMGSEKVKLIINDQEYETDKGLNKVNNIIKAFHSERGEAFTPFYSVERDQEGVDFVISMSGEYVDDLLDKLV